jgi:hypothetical protein
LWYSSGYEACEVPAVDKEASARARARADALHTVTIAASGPGEVDGGLGQQCTVLAFLAPVTALLDPPTEDMPLIPTV